MGMFDSFIVPDVLTCPDGHNNSYDKIETEFQTKSLENVLSVYRVGDEITSVSGWPLKIEHATLWAYNWCDDCRRMYGVDIVIKDGRFHSYSLVRWEDDHAEGISDSET